MSIVEHALLPAPPRRLMRTASRWRKCQNWEVLQSALVTIALTAQWTTVDEFAFSDHRPISLTLGFQTPALMTQIRWNLKKAAWADFTIGE